jgi:hypothetical protein
MILDQEAALACTWAKLGVNTDRVVRKKRLKTIPQSPVEINPTTANDQLSV